MNTRRCIVTGIGLTLLAGCAALDPRKKVEISPAGPETTDAPTARPAPQLAFVDAVKRKVKSARQAVEQATPPEAGSSETPDTPEKAATPVAAARVAPAVAIAPLPDVDWLNPDRFTLSNAPGVRVPVARRPARHVNVAVAGNERSPAVDAGSSVANVGQTIQPMPSPSADSPAAGAPVRASGHLAASSGDPAYPSFAGPVTATAVAPGAAAPVNSDPDALARRFAQRMRDYPTDVAAHFDYQMLRFVRDEPVPQLDALSTLPSEDRNLLTAVMDGMSNFRSGLRANRNMLLSEKVRPILEMSDRVRSQAQLNIPVIAICSRVQAFGVYDPMPTTLRAGIDNPMVVYCEIENFSSQQNDKGMWETKLSQEAVLYSADNGFAALKDKSDLPVDLSRNRRHDFFVAKKIMLPRTLNVGRYNLKVSIFDEQVKRIAENSISIQVMAQ